MKGLLKQFLFMWMGPTITEMLNKKQIKTCIFKVKKQFLTLNSWWSILKYKFLKMMSYDTDYPFSSFGNKLAEDLEHGMFTKHCYYWIFQTQRMMPKTKNTRLVSILWWKFFFGASKKRMIYLT